MSARENRILVAAHDAGGANLLLYKFLDAANVDFVLTGPAQILASSLGISWYDDLSLSELTKYSKVYVGSNCETQFSDYLLESAMNLGIPTVGVIDHWVNFSNRWRELPKKIEAQDIRAFIGGLYYFGFRMRYSRNSYLSFMKNSISSISTSSQELLVILQPIGNSYSHRLGNCFCSSIKLAFLRLPNISSIKLREHANTPALDCFNHLTKSIQVKISISGLNQSLASDISSSTYILGIDSYALYIGYKVNKKVFSILAKKRSLFAPKYKLLG